MQSFFLLTQCYDTREKRDKRDEGEKRIPLANKVPRLFFEGKNVIF